LGIPELGAPISDYQPSLGTGYNYRNFLKLDYSFIPHPELLSTHRFSISISPIFKGKKISRPGIQPVVSQEREKRELKPEKKSSPSKPAPVDHSRQETAVTGDLKEIESGKEKSGGGDTKEKDQLGEIEELEELEESEVMEEPEESEEIEKFQEPDKIE